MSVQQTYFTKILDNDGSPATQVNEVMTADEEHSISNVADATSTLEEDIAITVADIVAFFMVSDQNVTLKTNSTSVPDQTISLVANEPFWWNTHHGDCPLTVDITKLYFVNAGEVNANIKAGFLVTAT